ncbi:MAG: hypothetical protein ACRCU3_04050 [Eubacteriaceae bacterium]
MTGKKRLILIFSILLIASVIIGSTLAIWTATTSQDGSLSTGKVDGEILIQNGSLDDLFPGRETSYQVNIKNTGNRDMIPRAKVTPTWVNNPNLSTDMVTFTYNQVEWLDGGDGYYYYKGILSPNEITQGPLTESFTLSTSMNNDYKGASADILVELECVQAAANAISIWGKTYGELEITPPETKITGEEIMVTLVDETTNFTITGDIFSALQNLVPGETVTSNIEVKNSSIGIVDIFFKAQGLQENPEAMALLEKVSLTIKDTLGSVYYTGTLAGEDGTGNITLGSYAVNDKKDFIAEITLDPLADNQFQESIADLRLTYSAIEKTGGVDLTVTPVDMVDYIQGESLTNDTFPHVVIGTMTNFVGNDNKDTVFVVNGVSTTIEDYAISQYAFYRVLTGGVVSPVPTAGTHEDPEEAGTYIMKAKPEANLEIDRYKLDLKEAVLTCRPSKNQDTNELVRETLPTTPVTNPTATIPPGTVITNSAGVVVTDTSGVALHKGDLLDEGDHNPHYVALIGSMENLIFNKYGFTNYIALRMTLVDTKNGNIYLTTDEDNYITLTLPYPEGTTKDNNDFVILHYEEGDDLTNPFDYKVDAPVEIIPEKTDVGIQFSVNNFSPFAIGWKAIEKPVPPTPPTPSNPTQNGKGPKTGDDNNPFIWGSLLVLGVLGLGGTLYIIKRNKKRHES